MNKEYLDISCTTFSNDFKMFESVINQGIDAHLEAFTQSKFEIKKEYLVNRLYMKFHKNEIKILIKRLKEMNEKKYNEDIELWISDIENCIDINGNIIESE